MGPGQRAESKLLNGILPHRQNIPHKAESKALNMTKGPICIEEIFPLYDMLIQKVKKILLRKVLIESKRKFILK